MSKTAAKRDAITAAMDLAEDITSGKVDPAELDAELVDACRQLFGIVAGPDDPLFELQRDVTRQVLAAGGLTADELSEWGAVLRQRATESTGPSEPLRDHDVPGEGISFASGPHSDQIESSELGPEPGAEL